jgi:hypothetical protein
MMQQPRPLKLPPVFPLQKGLVLWLPMDERSGVKAYDRSGKKNHGTLNLPTWVAGRRGSALSFDGIDDYGLVNDATSLKPTTAITVIAWINPTDVVSDWRTIANKNYEYAWEVDHCNKELIVNCNIGGVYRPYYLRTTPPLVAGIYQQIAFTFDSTTGCLYYNAQLKHSRSDITGALGTSTYKLSIGARNQGSSLWFKGIIGEVRIYNRALTAAEVKRLYESERLNPRW